MWETVDTKTHCEKIVIMLDENRLITFCFNVQVIYFLAYCIEFLQIKKDNKTDITGKSKHGFKRKLSTNSVGLVIQSIIAHALDEDQFCSIANIWYAFDIANVKLLLQRMSTVGLPEDVVELVDIWLSTHYCYVNIAKYIFHCF